MIQYKKLSREEYLTNLLAQGLTLEKSREVLTRVFGSDSVRFD